MRLFSRSDSFASSGLVSFAALAVSCVLSMGCGDNGSERNSTTASKPSDNIGNKDAQAAMGPEDSADQAEIDKMEQAKAAQLNLAKAALEPDFYKTWPKPKAMLFITGQQNGYIEPCGCTGLDKQKGGIARRFTFIKQLKKEGYQLIPVDAGNQVRRIGQQALIKLASSDAALEKMEYQSIGFGPDDMRLPAVELLAVVAADDPESARYVSSNVVVFDESLVPSHKVVQQGGMKVGLTNVLDPKMVSDGVSADVEISDPVETLPGTLQAMESDGAQVKVVTFFGSEESARELVGKVDGIDLIVVAGRFGEPTHKPELIKGSKTQMIATGTKGMYAGLVGLYDDLPLKYARVPLSHEFGDDKGMRMLMAEYQKELEMLGLKRLGVQPVPHPSGNTFVGTKACQDCHQDAYEIWEGSPHAHATDSIVSPPEARGDVPRHFDPECLSCHVTGWNPQDYFPYESGYVDLTSSKHLHGNGCENCHGPGNAHVAAEQEGSGASDSDKEKFRLQMQLPLSKAKLHCMKCHDLDNSPDFHEKDAFEDNYWPQIEH